MAANVQAIENTISKAFAQEDVHSGFMPYVGPNYASSKRRILVLLPFYVDYDAILKGRYVLTKSYEEDEEVAKQFYAGEAQHYPTDDRRSEMKKIADEYERILRKYVDVDDGSVAVQYVDLRPRRGSPIWATWTDVSKSLNLLDEALYPLNPHIVIGDGIGDFTNDVFNVYFEHSVLSYFRRRNISYIAAHKRNASHRDLFARGKPGSRGYIDIFQDDDVVDGNDNIGVFFSKELLPPDPNLFTEKGLKKFDGDGFIAPMRKIAFDRVMEEIHELYGEDIRYTCQPKGLITYTIGQFIQDEFRVEGLYNLRRIADAFKLMHRQKFRKLSDYDELIGALCAEIDQLSVRTPKKSLGSSKNKIIGSRGNKGRLKIEQNRKNAHEATLKRQKKLMELNISVPPRKCRKK